MWKYFYGLCFCLLCACTTTKQKEVTSITEQTALRPDSFASDSAMLDYIQKVHFNYMWDGAEKKSGLALERIHLDGYYPQHDSLTVTYGEVVSVLPEFWWLSSVISLPARKD